MQDKRVFVTTEITLLGVKDEVTKHSYDKGFMSSAEAMNKYSKHTDHSLLNLELLFFRIYEYK